MRFDISSVRCTDGHVTAAIVTVDTEVGFTGDQVLEISVSIHARKSAVEKEHIFFITDKKNYNRLIEEGKMES